MPAPRRRGCAPHATSCLTTAELPKTISGKIRRVELRTAEQERLPAGAAPPDRAPGEFWEEDLPELRH
jgi:acetyl-CoA synthetase